MCCTGGNCAEYSQLSKYHKFHHHRRWCASCVLISFSHCSHHHILCSPKRVWYTHTRNIIFGRSCASVGLEAGWRDRVDYIMWTMWCARGAWTRARHCEDNIHTYHAYTYTLMRIKKTLYKYYIHIFYRREDLLWHDAGEQRRRCEGIPVRSVAGRWWCAALTRERERVQAHCARRTREPLALDVKFSAECLFAGVGTLHASVLAVWVYANICAGGGGIV